MAELIKTESGIFKDHYEGINRDKKVICILDNNCVRFSVLKKTKSSWKQVSRKEFDNSKKDLCFKKATEALNK